MSDVRWEYTTTSGPRKTWDDADTPPEGEGWIRDLDRGCGEGWERFDYHEESYWKRPLGQKSTVIADMRSLLDTVESLLELIGENAGGKMEAACVLRELAATAERFDKALRSEAVQQTQKIEETAE